MKKLFAVLIVAIVPLLFANVVSAESMNIKPGKWQYKITSRSPMMPDAQVMTDTKCITAEEAKSDPLTTLLEDNVCKVLSKEQSGNTIKFELECEAGMGNKMRGNGVFTANGTTASGKMEMTMNMGDQSMKMTQEWEGKRIGNCD